MTSRCAINGVAADSAPRTGSRGRLSKFSPPHLRHRSINRRSTHLKNRQSVRSSTLSLTEIYANKSTQPKPWAWSRTKYGYDAWGNGIEGSGTDANPYRYAGERFDVDTGLIYLRARWYDPSVGRFVSSDTLEAGLAHPREANRYVYAESDPVDGRDPSGHLLDTGGTLTSLGAQAILTSTSTSVGARILLTVAVAAATAVTGILTNTQIEQARRERKYNAMRLQLQQGNNLHYWSKATGYIDPFSVEKPDIYGLLGALALACEVGGDCVDSTGVSFPGRLTGELRSAIIRMSKWVKSAQGPISGGIYTWHQEYVEDLRIATPSKRPRIDLEQVIGTNIRK